MKNLLIKSKKLIGICTALCMIFCVVPEWHVSAEKLTTSAKACILIEAATGRILFEQNAQEKLPMASTTKIMTTLLTIESGDLDTEFQVDNQAIHVEGSSMGLQENDIVTKRALCYGMLLPSGNDAANVSAVAVAGSIPEFAKLMNERAKEIGMTRTCFVTPSGLEGTGHGSSAYDMALLTREALQNDLFREICSQAQATVNFGNPPYARTLYNSNKLLRMYDGVIGVKTGFTDEAGRCLVSACERDNMILICVTLNDRDDWNDHMKLYDYGFSQIHPVELQVPEIEQELVGSTRKSIPLKIQDPVVIGAVGQDFTDITGKILLSPFAYAPVADGDMLGELEYYYQDRKICSVPLLADGSAEVSELPEQSWIEKFFAGFRNFLKSA